MDVIETMLRRRSCRKFTAEPVSAVAQKSLERALLCAPTSKNCKSTRFVLVSDAGVLRRLGESRDHGASFLAGCTLAVAVYADPEATDVWTEDASIAAAFLLLAAEDLGLGACWCQMRARGRENGPTAQAYVSELLGVADKGWQLECVVGLGHPAETHRPYDDERLDWSRIIK